MERSAGPAELVVDFLNTVDLESGEESLASPRDAVRWLAGHGIPPGDLDAAGLERLRAFREALRALVWERCTGEHDERALALLAAEARRAPLIAAPRAGGVELVPARGGADGVIAALLGAVHTACAEGTWERVKVCASHPCRWAFVDRSRNRSRSWCSMAVCGNRAKARSFRRRSASSGGRAGDRQPSPRG